MNQDLESLVEPSITLARSQPDYQASFIRKYTVDTTAAWMFYTPIMASIEKFIAGMDNKEVLKSRLFAAAYHAIFMRPYGKFREWYAKKWKADPDSSRFKKFLVDTSAMILVQTPSYSAILLLSGASLE